MKTAPEADGAAPPIDAESTVSPTPELHYGDLRKGAYLRRRANYQLQAGSPNNRQASGMLQATDATAPKPRKPG